MAAVITMIESASVLVLALLFISFVGERLADSHWKRGLVLGLAFAVIGLIAMSTPVEPQPGIRTDARSAVLALSAAIGGPVSAFITASVLSTARILYGGVGAQVGALAVWAVAGSASAIWFWWTVIRRETISYKYIVLHTLNVAIVPTLVIYLFRSSSSLETYVHSVILLGLPTNAAAVLFLGGLFVRDAQRRWAMRAHRASQARFEAIARNAPAVIFEMVAERGGRASFTYLSGAAKDLLGIAPEKLLHDPGRLEQLMAGGGPPDLQQQLMHSAEEMRPFSLRRQCVLPDGRMIWIRVAGQPRNDDEGRIVWDGSIHDVTEYMLREEVKNEFIATVSHELRTPLTSIRGSLGLVAAGAAGELPDKARNLVRIAHSNSERLVRLINDILDIEKIESGRMPFNMQVTPLRPLVLAAMEANKGDMHDRGVSVSLVDEAPGVKASVDVDRFHQVLVNLLSNAAKFSPNGGTVTLTISRRDGAARVKVSDTGPGIPQEFRSRIFGKFEQADGSDARRKNGTGLGLSICKAIAEHMEGAVGFETEEGTGTSFFLDLPERTGDGEQLPTGAASGRILVCEDDEDTAQVIAEVLQAQGWSCDIVHEAETAFRLANERTYVAMTLDIKLVGSSGVDLFRKMRANAATADLPIVVISAYVDEARSILNGHATQMADWLDKPVDPARLTSTLHRLMARRPEGRTSVLHVEDDADLLAVITATLGDRIEVSQAQSLAAARLLLGERRFDVVILDLALPDGSGEELLAEIPEQTKVVIFSASDAGDSLGPKVSHSLTKTRTTELELAALIREITDGEASDVVELKTGTR